MTGGLGRMLRKEDQRFIRGRGYFVDDVQLPGMLYGAVLRLSEGAVQEAGIGLTAVGAEHFVAAEAEEFLRGRAPDENSFKTAGAIAAEHCHPAADQRGPEDYKRHLVAELTARALRRAAERAP